MNGTDRASLHNGFMQAHDAVIEAIQKVKATSPNGRDYYPQGSDAIIHAGREHRDRIVKLQRIAEELEQLCLCTMRGA